MNLKNVIIGMTVLTASVVGCKAPQMSAEEMGKMANEKAAVKILEQNTKYDNEAQATFQAKVDARAAEIVAQKKAELTAPK